MRTAIGITVKLDAHGLNIVNTGKSVSIRFCQYSPFLYLGHLSTVTMMQISIRGCSLGAELQIEEFYISSPVTLCMIFKVCFFLC